jgi:hypothetical protein
MRTGILMAVLALFFFAGQPADPAEARSRTYYSFSYSGGGVSVTVGRAPRYYAQRRYYRVPRRGYYYRYQAPAGARLSPRCSRLQLLASSLCCQLGAWRTELSWLHALPWLLSRPSQSLTRGGAADWFLRIMTARRGVRPLHLKTL